MNKEHVISLLRSLVAIPSVNPKCNNDPSISGENRIADFLMDWGHAHNIPCRRYEAEKDRPCVLFSLGTDREGAPVLLYSVHSDTVWSPGMDRPFELKEKDGLFFGLGAVDDKGPMTAALLAMSVLKTMNLSCRLHLLCSCDEEVGYAGINYMVPDHVKPNAAVILEGTSLDVITAHKGTVRYRISTRGESAHSSLVPQGRNAIYPMSVLISATEKLAAELLLREKHPLLGPPTLNLGTIRGGTQVNSVPDYCEFTVDRRMLPGETPEEIGRELCSVYDGCGVEYEMEGPIFYSAPFETVRESKWSHYVHKQVKSQFSGSTVHGVLYATEASRVAEFNIPAVVFGPGSISTAHSPNENIDPNQIVTGVDCLVAIAAEYGK